MSEIEILKQFKDGLITFLDELIDQFPQEGDLIIIRIFLKDRIPITDMMNTFVINILPFKKMVIDRNEDFFLNHCNILDSHDKSKVNKFKTLWRSPYLDDDNKRIVWEWFDSFIYLAEKYQKSKM